MVSFLAQLFGQQPQPNRLAQPLPANMPAGLEAIQQVLAGELEAAASRSHPGTMLRNLGNGQIEKINSFGNRQIIQGGGMASAPQIAPQQATQAPTQAFQPQQGMAQPGMPQPAPQAPRGGGIWDGIGDAIANIFDPDRKARNHTVGWLQRQGLDEGTATLVAGNKHLLQNFLVDRMKGDDPMAGLEREYKQAQIDKMRLDMETARNPTTDDIKEYQFAVKQGYEGTLPEFMTEMKRAGAINVNNVIGGDQLTPGQKKIDESFADTYLQWQGGGYADSAKQIEQLTESLDILDRAAQNGDNISGAIGALPSAVQPFVNPQGTIAREGVEEVVQRSLREILGAQFTEKEGERLIARAYNPLLPPAENAKRVRRLLGQVQSLAASRQEMVDFFDENGTLRGYKGKRPSASQMDSLAAEWEREDGRAGRGTPEQSQIPDGVDPSDWEFMTPEERRLFQ